ncbi:MAG: hypothetical protein U1F25_17885 [Rubrivivax sp.]
MSHRRPLIAALVLAAGGLGAAASAQAHPEVQWSVTIGTPGVGVAVPVPAPFVVVPAPRVHALPPPARVVYREPTRWDVDGDGIPNRYDRVYNPRWDVDGDGIPNRRDAHPGTPDRGAYRDHGGPSHGRDDRGYGPGYGHGR